MDVDYLTLGMNTSHNNIIGNNNMSMDETNISYSNITGNMTMDELDTSYSNITGNMTMDELDTSYSNITGNMSMYDIDKLYSDSISNMSTFDIHTLYNITGNLSGVDIDIFREQLSDQMALVLLPAMIVLGTVLVTGAVGNTLVFYIYYSKFNSSSTRTAIIALACFDLLTCAVCIPGEIFDLRFSYNFTSQVLCKGFRTTTTIILIASGFTLLSVALDRYQRICNPLQQQLTSKRALYRVLLSCVLATIFAVPASIVYGLAHVKTPVAGLYGIECSTSQYFSEHPLRISYSVILCTIFMVAFTTMIIIYILIGRQVVRQTHFRQSVQQRKGSNGSARRQTLCSDTSSEGDHSVSDRLKDLANLHETIHESGSPTDVSPPGQPLPSHNGRTDPRLSRKYSVLRRLGKMSRTVDVRTRKTTVMLFFITVVFVVSFLPHLAIKAVQAGNKNFVSNLSPVEVVFYNIFVRSYFFNTAVNAFVYGFCSPKFRHESRTLFFNLAFWMKSKTISIHSEDIM